MLNSMYCNMSIERCIKHTSDWQKCATIAIITAATWSAFNKVYSSICLNKRQIMYATDTVRQLTMSSETPLRWYASTLSSHAPCEQTPQYLHPSAFLGHRQPRQHAQSHQTNWTRQPTPHWRCAATNISHEVQLRAQQIWHVMVDHDVSSHPLRHVHSLHDGVCPSISHTQTHSHYYLPERATSYHTPVENKTG